MILVFLKEGIRRLKKEVIKEIIMEVLGEIYEPVITTIFEERPWAKNGRWSKITWKGSDDYYYGEDELPKFITDYVDNLDTVQQELENYWEGYGGELPPTNPYYDEDIRGLEGLDFYREELINLWEDATKNLLKIGMDKEEIKETLSRMARGILEKEAYGLHLEDPNRKEKENWRIAEERFLEVIKNYN